MLAVRPFLGTLAIAFFAVAASHAESRHTTTGDSAAERLIRVASDSSQCSERGSARAWLRNKIVRDADLEKYGLRLDADSTHADPTMPVVILIHGFNSTPKQNMALMAPFHDAGFPCGTFAYPNDYMIRYSAQLLASELRRFHQQYPQRPVVLVCHSMGGLVARACVEDPLYDPGNVHRLIMIAPPTHGTVIAHFAVGTDVWEHWLAREDGWPWQRLRDSIVDGLGEAAIDLCPCSDFLRELNSRPRNPRVHYTVLLGSGAAFSESQVLWIRQSVCHALAKVPGGAATAAELDAMLADIDELVEGKGDGVVAIKRGRLDGVSDTLVMPFGHIAVTGAAKNAATADVQRVVFARVQTPMH